MARANKSSYLAVTEASPRVLSPFCRSHRMDTRRRWSGRSRRAILHLWTAIRNGKPDQTPDLGRFLPRINRRPRRFQNHDGGSPYMRLEENRSGGGVQAEVASPIWAR